MNLSPIFDAATVDRLGWTLAHFLWQGALVAAVAAAVLRLMSRSGARSRYAVTVGALAVMLVAPLATFLLRSGPKVLPANLSVPVAAPAFSFIDVQGSALTASATGWMAWLVAVWLLGVLACSIRLAVGWTLTLGLLRDAAPVGAHGVRHAFAEILERLRVSQPVRLLRSARIDTPVVVGWLRPAILLPATALTGLDETQLRAVLAHELAHIRRHDYLVNLLQRAVESLLFYHPAVWWLSARIRAEREHCCDDLAVELCGSPLLYAGALVQLERARAAAPALATAATGGDLAARVRRILGRESVQRGWLEPVSVSILLVAFLIGAACGSSTVSAQAPPPPPPPAPQAAASPQAPRPPAPPPQAPPPAAERRSFGFRTSSGDATAWVMYRGDKVMMNGSSTDELEARMLRKSIPGDFLWFRRGASSYVIQDQATLAKVVELFRPMEELGAQQRELGAQQRELGARQRELGQHMRQVRITLPDLTADLERLRAQLRSEATQEELSRLQRQLGELQSRIGSLQGKAGEEQSRIGRQMSELGRQQSELGARQSRLGAEQSEIGRKATEQVRAILEDAIKSGKARAAL